MTINLKEKYIEASSKRDFSNGEATTTLLYKNPWVRILLEQHIEDTDVNRLEVEVAFPEIASSNKNNSIEFDQFTEHIKYLQSLRENGFELFIIGSGCILTASKILDQTPDDNIFRVLLPPEVPP